MKNLLLCVLIFVLVNSVLPQEKEEKALYDKNKVFDGRGQVPFKVLDNPKFISAKDAEYLNDNDYILGISLDGESKAYPTKMMAWHHIANDVIGTEKTPISVVY